MKEVQPMKRLPLSFPTSILPSVTFALTSKFPFSIFSNPHLSPVSIARALHLSLKWMNNGVSADATLIFQPDMCNIIMSWTTSVQKINIQINKTNVFTLFENPLFFYFIHYWSCTIHLNYPWKKPWFPPLLWALPVSTPASKTLWPFLTPHFLGI